MMENIMTELDWEKMGREKPKPNQFWEEEERVQHGPLSVVFSLSANM